MAEEITLLWVHTHHATKIRDSKVETSHIFDDWFLYWFSGEILSSNACSFPYTRELFLIYDFRYLTVNCENPLVGIDESDRQCISPFTGPYYSIRSSVAPKFSKTRVISIM